MNILLRKLISSLYFKFAGTAFIILISLLVYRRFRIRQWRKILRGSIDYHRLHLSSIAADQSVTPEIREQAQSLLWGISKQLPFDIREGGGLAALLRTFSGGKTSLNTCGTVFCECAKNYKSTDKTIIKLTNTLTSTIYRIFILESRLSILGLLYYDFSLLLQIIMISKSGTGGFYKNIIQDITAKS